MNKKSKFKLGSILFILIFSVIPLVSGAWTENSYSGTWTDKTMNELTQLTDGEYSGVLNLTLTGSPIENFSGYKSTWYFNINASDIGFWDIIGRSKRFYYVYEFESTNGESIFTNPVIAQANHPWLSAVFRTYMINDWTYQGGDGSGVTIYVYKQSETLISIGYEFINSDTGYSEGYSWQNQTVTSGFLDDVSIHLYVGHDQFGTFENAQTVDTVYQNDNIPFMPELSTFDPLTILPQPVQDLINFITEVGTFLSNMLGMVLSTLGSLTLLLPAFFVAYALDALLTSIDQGSVQPIGYFMQYIFNLALRIIGVMADIISAIIPF